MTLGETMISVWQQVLAEGKGVVELQGEPEAVNSTGRKKLPVVEFAHGPYRLVGIEQNPQTSSHWALLARQGKRVMQYRCKGRYIANVCEGKLLRYPAWRALDLPE
jgi:hypothetical protein